MAKTKTTAKSPAGAKKKAASTAKKASPKAKAVKATAKTTAKKKPASKAGGQEVTLDRRGKPRRESVSAKKPTAEPAKLERRAKVNRRRQIDPTTCERDYSDQEVQFMNAMDEYKRASGRMFPTCSEVLEVIRGLGYVQLSPADLAAHQGEQADEQLDQQAEAAAEEALEESEGLRVMSEEFSDA